MSCIVNNLIILVLNYLKKPTLVSQGNVILQRDKARPYVTEMSRKKIKDLG